jgi:hypothetical protein
MRMAWWRLRHWLSHAMGTNRTHVRLWMANCGKVMRATECECGERSDIRPIPEPGKKQGKFNWS